MKKKTFTRRDSLALLGAAATPSLGVGGALAQVIIPPIPGPRKLPVDATTALLGRFILSSGSNGRFVLANIGAFTRPVEWTVGLGVKFNAFPPQRAFLLAKGGIGIVVEGKRVGVAAYMGGTLEQPDLRVALSDRDVLTGPSNGFPDDVYYIALSAIRDLSRPHGYDYRVYVDGRQVATLKTAEPAQALFLNSGAYLGGGFDLRSGAPIPTAWVDGDFNFIQAFDNGIRDQWSDSRGVSFFDNNLVMFYDFTKQPPVRVLDNAIYPPYPRYDLAVNAEGTAHQKARGKQNPLKLVAEMLAPVVRLHSKERHFPCSVEWYLARSRIVKTVLNESPSIPPPERLQMQSRMEIAHEGPVDGAMLKAASTAPFGKDTDRVFLWPLEAKPGEKPTWPGGTCLSDYQLETVAGWRPQDNQCSAPCYCHIVSNGNLHNINYYFFYAYNGGLGGVDGTDWSATALGPKAGLGAHFGDWERVTVKVRVFDDLSCEVLSVIFEQHGDPTDVGISHPRQYAGSVPRIRVYAAWHSHASYPSTGEQSRVWYLPNDFSDAEGATWETRESLVMLDGHYPDWVYFNGDWGPRITIAAGIQGEFSGRLVGGPSGPAYQGPWLVTP